MTFPGPSRGRGAQAFEQDRGQARFGPPGVCGGSVNLFTAREGQLCPLPPDPASGLPPTAHSQLQGRRKGQNASFEVLPPQATNSSAEPHFPHLQNGDTNRMHLQGVPGITRDLSTSSRLTQHTGWDGSTWVCPFQLQWTVLLVHQRCSIKVYYVKNTSLGLRHSPLRPVWPPPLNPEHTEATGAELPVQVWAYLALLADS